MKIKIKRQPTATIFVGDVLTRIADIPDKSVQCVVTSPPYWGLRDYGTADWEGGDPDCAHTISMPTKWNDPKRGTSVLRPEVAHRGGDSKVCHVCGATRIDQQIGLEETPEEYIATMRTVFMEIHRILKDDGVLWLNIGDSYYNNFGGGGGSTTGNAKALQTRGRKNISKHPVLKMKDLVGIPWRLAFALQEAGWYLRQDIIWHKTNPMPEPVKDRCTKSHEYLFMLTKNSRYWFDSEAMKEPAKWDRWGKQTVKKEQQGTAKWIAEKSKEDLQGNKTRNKRSVWSIPTRPFKGAHFAVMPEALVEPCILSSTKEGDTVFDPFTGSGTVGAVSVRLHREFMGVELNPEYVAIIEQRLGKIRIA